MTDNSKKTKDEEIEELPEIVIEGESPKKAKEAEAIVKGLETKHTALQNIRSDLMHRITIATNGRSKQDYQSGLVNVGIGIGMTIDGEGARLGFANPTDPTIELELRLKDISHKMDVLTKLKEIKASPDELDVVKRSIELERGKNPVSRFVFGDETDEDLDLRSLKVLKKIKEKDGNVCDYRTARDNYGSTKEYLKSLDDGNTEEFLKEKIAEKKKSDAEDKVESKKFWDNEIKEIQAKLKKETNPDKKADLLEELKGAREYSKKYSSLDNGGDMGKALAQAKEALATPSALDAQYMHNQSPSQDKGQSLA